MRMVTKRQLNQQTAAVLDQVTDADDVVVTERGKPRWRLGTVTDRETTLERLERVGQYSPPAAKPAPWLERPSGPTYTDAEADVLLDEMRGDH